MKKKVLHSTLFFVLLAGAFFNAQAMKRKRTDKDTIAQENAENRNKKRQKRLTQFELLELTIHSTYPYVDEAFLDEVEPILEVKKIRTNFIIKKTNQEALVFALMTAAGNHNNRAVNILLKYEEFRTVIMSDNYRKYALWALQDAHLFSYNDTVNILLKKLSYTQEEKKLVLNKTQFTI